MRVSQLPLAALLYSEINILSFVVMIIIAICALRATRPATHKSVLFAMSVCFAAAANVFDFFWNIGNTEVWVLPEQLRETVNFCYFVSLGVSTYLWFMYTQISFDNIWPSKKEWALSALPLFALVALLVVSHFNGCLFYFDAEGDYHRGNLYYLQQILAFGNLIIASVSCLFRALAAEYYDRKTELLSMSAFIIPPLACTALQIQLQKLPILSVGILISFLLAFINGLESLISKDELTEIGTRREMMRCLSGEIKALKPDDNLYFFFLDIDHFKRLNDRYGHAEGDKALKVLAKVLKHVSDQEGGFCARYGGDEFALLAKCATERDAHMVKERIKMLARDASAKEELKSVLSVSVGYAEYSSDMNGIQQFIAAADEEMYKEKTATHSHEQ